jgi:hypothetical protein
MVLNNVDWVQRREADPDSRSVMKVDRGKGKQL